MSIIEILINVFNYFIFGSQVFFMFLIDPFTTDILLYLFL